MKWHTAKEIIETEKKLSDTWRLNSGKEPNHASRCGWLEISLRCILADHVPEEIGKRILSESLSKLQREQGQLADQWQIEGATVP